MSNLKRPIILAICGKSATGKTSTSQRLSKTLYFKGVANNIIVSDTTRSPRICETDNIDYHFVSKEDFLKELKYNNYLE